VSGVTATQAYHNWIAAGEPYTLAAWMNDLVKTLRGHGYTVYHYPDNAHLMATYPQDHAPFSYTGWPIDSPFGVGHGVDIMPKAGTDVRALEPLARQIIADKRAGLLPGLKYINWTDKPGAVWQTSWKPTEATRPNADKGHLHLSGRSDSRYLRLTDYDPSRLAGGSEVTPEEIRTVVRQVFLALTEERTDDGYIAVDQGGDILNDSIRSGVGNTLVDVMRELKSIKAANRDQDMLDAVNALSDAIRVGGGNVEVAPIIAELREIGAGIERMHVRMDELGAQNAQIKASMAELPGGVVSNLVDELTD
jgi:hypothetical protein